MSAPSGAAVAVWLLLQDCALSGTVLIREWRDGRSQRIVKHMRRRVPQHFHAALYAVASLTNPGIKEVDEVLHEYLRSER